MKNKSPFIMNITSINDIELLKNSGTVKYINIDITNPNKEVIDYLLKNGKEYSYSDLIEDRRGYIYVDHETFINAENIINSIISNMPANLTDLEKSRYLYISLGRLVGYDINILPDKNENFNFNLINTVNNLWASISNKVGTNTSYTKLYLYLCSLVGISSEIITTNDYGYKANKLTIDIDDNKHVFIVDITKDVPLIEARFKTEYFGNYNDNTELDLKVGYISDTYSDIKLDNALKKLNYADQDILGNILHKSEEVLTVRDLKPIELGIVYNMILKKYYPKDDVTISNLFLNDIHAYKEHFILISDKEYHYSFNYRKNTFLPMNKRDLLKNIETEKIGIYMNESIPNIRSN